MKDFFSNHIDALGKQVQTLTLKNKDLTNENERLNNLLSNSNPLSFEDLLDMSNDNDDNQNFNLNHFNLNPFTNLNKEDIYAKIKTKRGLRNQLHNIDLSRNYSFINEDNVSCKEDAIDAA